MPIVEVVPGLVLDGELYETAAAGIATHAPDVAALSWETFVRPRSWLLVPDEQGELSKAEMTVATSVERTVRLNLWFRADLRGGNRPVPHNHPWVRFEAQLLLGGYDEDRYERTDSGAVVAQLGVVHASPAVNAVDHDTFHEVRAVHAPGRTMSLMVCGRGQRGDWGHLDIDTGEAHRSQPVVGFDAMLAALNPQHDGAAAR
jgi:hypothetical protein